MLARPHGAGTGDDDESLAPDGNSIDIDNSGERLDLAARELERLQDRHHALDTIERFKTSQSVFASIISNCADDRAELPTNHVGVVAHRPNLSRDVVNLLVRCSRLQDNDH